MEGKKKKKKKKNVTEIVYSSVVVYSLYIA
jgi:hypothetical protein